MANPTIDEIFEKAANLKTKKEKIAYIQEQASVSPAFRDILRINFDQDVVCLLPEGEPPYKKDDAPKGYQYQSLHKAYREFTYFFKGGQGSTLPPVKRESMFVNLLESLHADEAQLLVLAKDRKLKYKGITKKFIQETLPGLIVK
tara:strand:+ start:40 stop:474 length:435 start_codon:yes stop_codon:yes gene_type:complete